MKRFTIFFAVTLLFCCASISAQGLKFSVGVGGSFSGNFGGGVTWANPPVERLTMPYSVGGGYVFFDARYAEFSVGYYAGSGKWSSSNASDVRTLPVLSRSVLNFGVLAKYPIEVLGLTAFPLAGVDYDAPISGNLKFAGGLAGEVTSEINDLAALWLRFGGGVDMGFGSRVYLRVSLLYGVRASSALEKNYVSAIKSELGRHDAEANLGHGLSARAGVGFRF